jgi:hypothetical protein
MSTYWCCFGDSRIAKALLVGTIVLALVWVSLFIPAGTKVAQAGCSNAGEYAAWHKHGSEWKRAVYVWSPRMDRQLERMKFNGRTVSKDRDKGISHWPTARDGDWQVHHISKTYFHTTLRWWGDWDNDSLWDVRICD